MQCVNGTVASTLPLNDRSIQFGDGVFRTMRKERGRIAFWDAHYAKLQHDASAINIPCPPQAVLEADLGLLGQSDAVVKIILSRGCTQQGYAAPADLSVTRIVQASPLPQRRETWLTQGVDIRFADWRLSSQPRLAGIKHLNRLDQVMARREWSDPDIVDSLMRDQNGSVIEGVMSNVFIWRQGKLLTPDLTACGVAGVTRDQVMAAAKQLKIAILVQPLTPDDILRADAVLLTNSIWGVIPVRQCGKRRWEDFSVCHLLRQTLFVE